MELLEKVVDSVADEFRESSKQNLVNFTFSVDWDRKLLELGQNGTNIDMNKNDPTGDGDQSPLRNEAEAQFHRDIWSAGGNTNECIPNFSSFVMACLVGDVRCCEKYLKKCKSQEAKTLLLEKRHTILRLPVLFLATIGLRIVGGGQVEGHKDNVAVVRLLIEHGARVDARDLCGKTIIHYTSGPLSLGDRYLYTIADLCIARSKELNLTPKLVDMQDRFGSVPMAQGVLMNSMELVQFLCDHGADVNITDYEDGSPSTMSRFSPSVGGVITRARNLAAYKEFVDVCISCAKTGVGDSFKKCGQCKKAIYCSKDCQIAHWKTHKLVCLSPANTGIVVSINKYKDPKFDNMTGVFLQSGKRHVQWRGEPPPGVAYGAHFDIKVQLGVGGSSEAAFSIYNKDRSLSLSISPGYCARYRELHELVSSYKPCQGLKAYFKAAVIEKGELVIYTDQMFVCKW